MSRNVDETEWLTRATAPLRLARFIQRRTSKRKLQILCCTLCQLIEQHASEEFQNYLKAATAFAYGDITASEYHKTVRRSSSSLQLELILSDSPSATTSPANLAIQAAISENVVAGIVRSLEWVLLAGNADPDLPAHICDIFRELIGNPFRPWKIQPPWLTPGIRTAPDGSSLIISTASFELAGEIHRKGRFDLLPMLADELESGGLTDPSLIHHCRGEQPHLRGCWAVDLVLGRE